MNKYNKTIQLINKCHLINKRVKKIGYNTETSKFCFHCGTHKAKAKEYTVCHESTYGDHTFTWTKKDYPYVEWMYKEKTMLIKSIIALIKDNGLSIKYGLLDGVMYFEIPGRQVSFHVNSEDYREVKKFHGKWDKRKNKTSPFLRK